MLDIQKVEAIQCEQCGLFLFLSRRRKRIAPLSGDVPTTASCHRIAADTGQKKEAPGIFAGRLVRVALRMELRSADHAKKARALVRGFQGVTEVNGWGGNQGLVVVGYLDPQELRVWLEELGIRARLILVSSTLVSEAGREQEVLFQTRLRSIFGVEQLRQVILKSKGVREVSARLMPDKEGTHLFSVRGTMDYTKLSSYIEEIWAQSATADGRRPEAKKVTGGRVGSNHGNMRVGKGIEENVVSMDHIYLS